MLLQTKQSFIPNLGGHLVVLDLGRELQVGELRYRGWWLISAASGVRGRWVLMKSDVEVR
jgi:hypothetical protein